MRQDSGADAFRSAKPRPAGNSDRSLCSLTGARRADEFAATAFDCRDGNRDRDHPAVSVAARRLEGFDPLAHLQPEQDVRLFIPFVIGNDQIDRLSIG